MMTKIENIIPIIYEELTSDGDNESPELFAYYLRCNQLERTAINKFCIYLCGWSFETILEKCGIAIDEMGEPVVR
jgi:hypothetical protein